MDRKNKSREREPKFKRLFSFFSFFFFLFFSLFSPYFIFLSPPSSFFFPSFLLLIHLEKRFRRDFHLIHVASLLLLVFSSAKRERERGREGKKRGKSFLPYFVPLIFCPPRSSHLILFRCSSLIVSQSFFPSPLFSPLSLSLSLTFVPL